MQCVPLALYCVPLHEQSHDHMLLVVDFKYSHCSKLADIAAYMSAIMTCPWTSACRAILVQTWSMSQPSLLAAWLLWTGIQASFATLFILSATRYTSA
ncbi:hypothetical protein GY45DRAFT_88745 [Cubamyces sp. BRFM 1775]|nr:hypothetical protein GY45DRAFT_88745 [Cubamyces sp. BRFM 1775]